MQQFRTEMLDLNPGLAHDDYMVKQRTSAFHKEVLAQDAGIRALRERGEQRERERQEAQEAQGAKVVEARRELARVEIERAKERSRFTWLESGGSEQSFKRWWESKGEMEFIEARMRTDAAQAARPGAHY